jgi:putative tricarboxylic transport membrane protein
MLRELLTALLLLSIAAAYYVAASAMDASALADEVGPAGLPIAYAFVLGGIAILLAARTLFARYVVGSLGPATPGAARADGRILLRAAGMLAIGVLYLLCVNLLGYPVTLAAVIFMVAIYQGERTDLRTVLIAAGGACVFWTFFVGLLGIDMPSGFWPRLWGGEWTP